MEASIIHMAKLKEVVDSGIDPDSVMDQPGFLPLGDRTQWRNYERRSEAIASGRQAAGGARGRFWSTDCLLCTTEFSRISKERKKLKNKQNGRNIVYLYLFRYWVQFRLTVKWGGA